MRIFVDSWGFKAFIDSKEHSHLSVKNYLEKVWKDKGEVITSDYILDETITLLSTRLPFDKVKEFVNTVDLACATGFLTLIWILPDDFEKAKRLRLKYKDKPRISFTDFTTMVLMEKNQILDIVTDDKHFTEVGRNFNVVF